MKSWQLQEAKSQLSQLVKEAIAQGPQTISLRGEPSVIVISVKEYLKLTQPKQSLVQFMKQSPLAGMDLPIGRDKSKNRDIEL